MLTELLFLDMSETELTSLLSFGSNNEKSYGTVNQRTYVGTAIKKISTFTQYEVQIGKNRNSQSGSGYLHF